MRSDSGEARWEFLVIDLLQKLRVNRTEHQKEAESARRGYYKTVVEKLEKLLDKARYVKGSGDGTKAIDTYVRLEFPEDHTKDYDRIVDVLEMTNADTVKLTLGEFDKYVRDNWSWSESFKMSASTYK